MGLSCMRQRKSMFPKLRKTQYRTYFHTITGTITAIIIALFPNSLRAQQIETEELKTSTVTGKRTKAAWIDQPFSVAKVEIDDAITQQSRNLVESLRYTPGVMIQKTANGHGSPLYVASLVIEHWP